MTRALQRIVAQAAGSLASTIAVVLVVSLAAIAAAVLVFGLSISGATGLYFVVWWIAVFVVLPFGVRSQSESGEIAAGTEPGAPMMPALREKAIWTTGLAGMVLMAAAWLLPLAGL